MYPFEYKELFMDAFSKIRKSAGREEQKRQMINKAIDLLHKLANKRLEFDEAKSEISRVVSEYYVIDEEEGVKDDAKINLELMINNAFDVISGVKEEKLNLYQAIMLMNKVMAHQESVSDTVLSTKENEIESQKEDKPIEKPKKEEKIEVVKKTISKEEKLFAIHMNEVLENKKKLHQSIEELNEILKDHGFSLKALDPK